MKKVILMMSTIGLLLLGSWSSLQAESVVKSKVCEVDGEPCIVKLDQGIVGDKVDIMDEKNQIIASGKIKKKKGNIAVITISRKTKTVRQNYPVLVRINARASSNQYGDSFSK